MKIITIAKNLGAAALALLLAGSISGCIFECPEGHRYGADTGWHCQPIE
ncbi:MAG: hypothetical protein ACR2PJ_00635 [Pseudomonadales bacterium]